MKLSKLLQTLERIAEEYEISTPYIVGGLPRDKAFGIIENVKDIDITTGDKGSFSLALAANKVWPDAQFRTYDDGHSSLDFKNIGIDFSNNFVIPNIEKEIKNPTDLEKEIYSRDFTINTLLQPMRLEKSLVDITNKGLDDIKNKILRTPINPELTIGHDPKRILRGIKLIIKFDLTPVPELEDVFIKYRGNISNMSTGSIKRQINQMLDIDSKKTIDLLSRYKLLPIIPLSRMMTLELVKNRMVQNLLDMGE